MLCNCRATKNSVTEGGKENNFRSLSFTRSEQSEQNRDSRFSWLTVLKLKVSNLGTTNFGVRAFPSSLNLGFPPLVGATVREAASEVPFSRPLRAKCCHLYLRRTNCNCSMEVNPWTTQNNKELHELSMVNLSFCDRKPTLTLNFSI